MIFNKNSMEQIIMKENIKNIHPKQCYFCNINDGFNFMKRTYNYEVQFFGKWKNFFVLPMIGAGMDGYVLVFHKYHYHSMAEIPSADIKSLGELIKIIKKEIKKSYGKSVVFEHGSTNDNRNYPFDHAHINICPVPNNFDIRDEIEFDYKLSTMRNFSDLCYWRQGNLGRLQYEIDDEKLDKSNVLKKQASVSGYFYYENPSGKIFIHELDDLKAFQPHYIRDVLFKKLGKNILDWDKCIDSECQKRTISALSGLSNYLQPYNNGGKR